MSTYLEIRELSRNLKGATTRFGDGIRSHSHIAKGSLALVACMSLAGCGVRHQQALVDAPAATRVAFDETLAAKELAFHQGRVKRDPEGAIGWIQLSGAYLTLAKQSDNDAYAERAEEAARKSLELRRKNNGRAAMALSASLMEQHRFSEALEAAELAQKLDPSEESYQLSKADILIELGEYERANAVLYKIPSAVITPNGLAVTARLTEIEGDNEKALYVLEEAAKEVDGMLHLSPETVAWFHVKLGDLQTRLGKNLEARSSYEEALRLYPRDYKAMASLTRLAANEGKWDQVLDWGEKTALITKMTDIEALVGDAHWHVLKDKEAAEAHYSEIDQLNGQAFTHHHHDGHSHTHGPAEVKHTHNRLYAMMCADRNRRLKDALHIAGEDLQARRDVYAYDTYAWVAYKNEMYKEAAAAMDKALAHGTKDASMLAHAAMIYAKAGRRTRAEECLTLARGVNPELPIVREACSALGLR